MEYKEFMNIKALLLVIFSIISTQKAFSQIYRGHDGAQMQLNDVLGDIAPGDIIVLGEMHGQVNVRDQQMGILQGLRDRGLKVSVGMEFFNYTDQAAVQKFRSGVMSEQEFKETIAWGGYDFNLYSPQLLFPQSQNGEYGLALNMPRSVTGQIAKQGIESLNPAQKDLMPPQFELGNEIYKERFFEVMGGHLPPQKFANYFAAQSTWDDTMAWQTLEFMKDHSDQVFVIIVGEFHVAYGGGLPDRLKQRINSINMQNLLRVKTISQVWTEGLTSEQIQNEIRPSLKYGPRADFIFLANP